MVSLKIESLLYNFVRQARLSYRASVVEGLEYRSAFLYGGTRQPGNTMLPITKGKIWGVMHGYQHNAADNEGEDLGSQAWLSTQCCR